MRQLHFKTFFATAISIIMAAAPEAALAQAGQAEKTTQLIIRTQMATATRGTLTAVASCAANEVRLGGGYRTAPPALSSHTQLSIEASYPSGTRDWTVRAYHNGAADQAISLTAEAYCLREPIAEATIVSTRQVQSRRNEAATFFTADAAVTCPSGSVLTGGGFQTTRTKPNAGLYNAWISKSAPIEGRDGAAQGWRATLAAITWIEPPTRPWVRAHAVCAKPTSAGLAQSRVIEPGKVVQKQLGQSSIYGFDYIRRSPAECSYGQVALGGGFAFEQDLLVPHYVYENVTARGPDGPERKASGAGGASSVASVIRSDKAITGASEAAKGAGEAARDNPRAVSTYAGWIVAGVYGDQSATFGMRSYAACVKMPAVPFAVKIVSPEDGLSAPLDFSADANGDRTLPIRLEAEATNAGGETVSASFRLESEGEPLGAGNAIERVFPAPRCGVAPRNINVIAVDESGNLAFDDVTISVGRVC